MSKRQLELPSEVADEMFLAYGRCHQLEIWLREMVYLELKAHFGPDWWENQAKLALDRAGWTGIPPERSHERDNRHQHMSTPENDPLWFLSLDSLLKIIFDDTLWPLFEPYLTTKHLLKGKLEEFAPIRNRVAHCRNLHEDDLDRVRRLLRDLDKGFWKFCATYGDSFEFADELLPDPIRDGLMDELSSHTVDLTITYLVRPNATAEEVKATRKGMLYHFLYSTQRSNAAMDFERILKRTRATHRYVGHIILDTTQNLLEVTIPAVTRREDVLETAEGFFHACATLLTRKFVKEPHSLRDEEIALENKPFEQIAARWPHYVVPPSHPYHILDSSCPCSIFGV